jgi:anti-sigma B factor antagonist
MLFGREGQVGTFYIADDMAYDDDVVVLTVGGEIDYAASPKLKRRITDHLKSDGRHLVLDLSWTTFIDSTAIGVLMGAATRMQGSDHGSLAVVCSHDKVLQIFEVSGLDHVITLYSSCDEAISELATVSWNG